MMVDVAIYLAGRHVAEQPDHPCSVTEVEDLIRWTIEQLGTHCADQLFLLRRVDGEPMFGEHAVELVENLHDWEAAEVDSTGGEHPIEYAIGRYVAITQNAATFLDGARTARGASSS